MRTTKQTKITQPNGRVIIMNNQFLPRTKERKQEMEKEGYLFEEVSQ